MFLSLNRLRFKETCSRQSTARSIRSAPAFDFDVIIHCAETSTLGAFDQIPEMGLAQMEFDAMLAIRITLSDPQKADARSRYVDEHKLHLRCGQVEVLQSGPIYDEFGSAVGGVVVAEVQSIDEMRAFSAADPFVIHRVYGQISILEWRPTIDRCEVSVVKSR